MESFTIGQVARACGVGVETVRFYERQGLIARPARPKVGFRRYSSETVQRILFIQRSKALGFSLREIRTLLSLRVDSARSCDEVRKQAEAKIMDIEQRIGTLRGMRQSLDKLIADCRSHNSKGKCPILEALEKGGQVPAAVKKPIVPRKGARN